MIIYGAKKYYKEIGDTSLPCPFCKSIQNFKVRRWTGKYHLNYISLGKSGEGFDFECQHCKRYLGIINPVQVKKYDDLLSQAGGNVIPPNRSDLVIVYGPNTVGNDIRQMEDRFNKTRPIVKVVLVVTTVIVLCCFPILLFYCLFYI